MWRNFAIALRKLVVGACRFSRPVVITGIALVAFTSSMASAQATLVNSSSIRFASQLTSLTLADFDACGGNKLVVTAAGEGNGGNRTVIRVTYRSRELQQLVAHNDAVAGVQHSSIWTLDNPGAAGDIVVTWSGTVNGTGIGAMSLAGVYLDGTPSNWDYRCCFR